MKLKTLLVLVIAAVGVAAAAWYATGEREALIVESEGGGDLFQGLRAQVDDIDRVKLETVTDGPITLLRGDDGTWGVAEADGWPADPEPVAQALLQIANMQVIEPKTARPENHARLDLADIDAPGSRSMRITLADGEDVAADLLLGRVRPVELGGLFVRRAGEDQTWLVEGSFQPNRRPLQWLDRMVIDVDDRRIQRVGVDHREPPVGDYAVVKPMLEGEMRALAEIDIPDGQQAKPPHELNSVASILDFLIFDEVARAGGAVQLTLPDTTIRFETFDGLLVTMEVRELEGQTWVTLEASAGTRDPRLDAFVAEHAGQDSTEGRIADEMLTADAVAAEVASINQRVGGWQFRLTGFKTRKVTQTAVDMIEPVPAEPAAPTGG